MGVINDMVTSANGSLLATVASDKAVKVFDVINFDMINMIKLDYVPSCAAWVHKPGDAINVIAIAEETPGRSGCMMARAQVRCSRHSRSTPSQ